MKKEEQERALQEARNRITDLETRLEEKWGDEQQINTGCADVRHRFDSLFAAMSEGVIHQDAKGLPVVMADSTQLVRLFQNLVGNAIKFRGEDSPGIRLSAQKLDESYLFTVCDNGIGIEPQLFCSSFLVFQRLYTRREYPGAGMGPMLCKKIVERHGGKIWVESQPGQGFHFILPSADRAK
jgi:light-regulated signal transduction histidine kinase (bacteriophytochrome)